MTQPELILGDIWPVAALSIDPQHEGIIRLFAALHLETQTMGRITMALGLTALAGIGSFNEIAERHPQLDISSAQIL